MANLFGNILYFRVRTTFNFQLSTILRFPRENNLSFFMNHEPIFALLGIID